MTIKELIKELEKCNPEGTIFAIDEESGTFHPVVSIMDWFGDEKEYCLLASKNE